MYIYGSGQLYIWWIALSETYALLHKLRTGYGGIQNKVTLGNWRIWYWTHCHASPRISWHKREGTQVGLARTVYIHRIWLYIWWFPCQKYRVYWWCIQLLYGSGQPYVYVHFIWPCVWESPCLNYREYVCMVLANPIHELRLVCTVFGQPCISCAWFAQFLANPA